METENQEKNNLLLLAGPGILLGIILIYVPWIYIFHFSSAGVTLYLLIEKLQKKSPEAPASDSPGQALAIPRRLEDPVLRERLQNAEQLVQRMTYVAPEVERQLNIILRNGEYMASRQQQFMTGFLNWSSSRSNTIREMRTLRQKLDDVCVTANRVKCAGNTLGLAGGVGLMAAPLCPPLAGGAAIFQAAKIIGDVTVPAATLLENKISENYISKVKVVFRNDARCSEPIATFLVYSRDLDEKFTEIFQCSFTESNSDKITESIENKVEAMRYLVDATAIGRQIARGDTFNEKNLELLRHLFSSLEKVKEKFKNPRDIRTFKSFAQIVVALCGLGYVECYAQGLALLALKYLIQQYNFNLTPTMGVATQCLNEVPNLTMHAISLNRAWKIAREGKSEYSPPLAALESQLQYELDVLSRRYNELQQS